LLATILLIANATTHFSENFNAGWENRWVVSDWKKSEGTSGKWVNQAGEFGGPVGLKTSEDARFYSISAKFAEFSNEGKDLVIQYAVSNSQHLDCGGGYIKLLPAGFDQENFNGDTDYHIMFGPDICGSTKRTHVILSQGSENYLVNKEVRAETDVHSHLYTLIIRPDNTYVVKIDGEQKQTGTLEDDWDILAPKKIKDPTKSKPADWVDDKRIPDPTDVKPADWDNHAAEIADPEAQKPDDWDDDLDGAWVAPTVPNPEYKGEWRARTIDNPKYIGEWEHPQIDNPDYKPNPNLYKYSFGGIGIEIWQVKSGTVFSHILITDSEEAAQEVVIVLLGQQAEERVAKEKKDAASRAEAEAARAAADAERATEDEHAATEAELKEDL